MITIEIITTAGRLKVVEESGVTVEQVLRKNGVETNMKNSVNNIPVAPDYVLTEKDVTARSFTSEGHITLTVVKAITGN